MNEVVLTSDDSSSIYSSRFDALYHSKHGAIQESQHVFIKSGLQEFIHSRKTQELNVLEIGFGTGLNALLTWIEAESRNINISYTGLEAYPITDDLFHKLNYSSILDCENEFNSIHSSPWNELYTIGRSFTLFKKKCLFQEFEDEKRFDVIYFDAFAPNTQKELWNLDMMKKMYSLSQNGSILVTYCAKGVVRRTMQEAGFEVSRIPGPPGKREMLRAIRTT